MGACHDMISDGAKVERCFLEARPGRECAASCGTRLSCAAGASCWPLRGSAPAAAEAATPPVAREPRAAPQAQPARRVPQASRATPALLGRPAPRATAALPGRPAPRATAARPGQPAPQARRGRRARRAPPGPRAHRAAAAAAERVAPAARPAAGGSAAGGARAAAARAAAGGAAGSNGTLPSNSLAVRFANSVLSRWPNPDNIAGQLPGWEYNHGIVLRGIEQVWRHTNDARYLTYIQNFTDRYVNASGAVTISDPQNHSFDNLQPSIFLPLLYQQTGMAKYKTAADSIRARYDTIPRDPSRGYWHKQTYPNQMWLDSIYMGQPFLMRYATVFGTVRDVLHRHRVRADAADHPARARHGDRPALSRVGRQRRAPRRSGRTRRPGDRRRCGGARSAGTRCRWSTCCPISRRARSAISCWRSCRASRSG